MDNRTRNKLIAEDTMKIIGEGKYDIGDRVIEIKNTLENATKNSILYSPSMFDNLTINPRENGRTSFEVRNETTLNAVKRLKLEGYKNVAALNFASAKNPGGGFLKGSMAQEESLAIASGLYPCISQMKEMYEHNKSIRTCLYSDYMIYSPDVPVFKNEDGGLVDCYTCSFITAPAVNAGVVRKQERDKVKLINSTMKNRIEKILKVGIVNNCDAIILGAFGCGVFENNPTDVANYFKDCLVKNSEIRNQYKKVVFAVLDESKNEEMIKPFKYAFGIR